MCYDGPAREGSDTFYSIWQGSSPLDGYNVLMINVNFHFSPPLPETRSALFPSSLNTFKGPSMSPSSLRPFLGSCLIFFWRTRSPTRKLSSCLRLRTFSWYLVKLSLTSLNVEACFCSPDVSSLSSRLLTVFCDLPQIS